MLLAVFGVLSTEWAILITDVVAQPLLFVYGLCVGQAVYQRPLRQPGSGVLLVAIGLFVSGIRAVFH